MNYFSSSLLYILFFTTVSYAHILSIGVEVPFSSDDKECAQAWQAWKIAQTTVNILPKYWKNSLLFLPHSTSSSSSLTIALEAIPYRTPYDAWVQTEKFAMGPVPLCRSDSSNTSVCTVKRIGLIGSGIPYTLLPTRRTNLSHLGYNAPSISLTSPTDQYMDYRSRQPFYRMSYTDEMIVGGIFSFMQSTSWEVFTIMYVRNSFGTTSMETLKTLAMGSTSHIKLLNTVPFDSGNVESINTALHHISEGNARIVVLFAYSGDASIVLQRSYALHMTGKGWTWLGGEWVRETTYLSPLIIASTEDTSSTGTTGHRRLTEVDGPTLWSTQQAVYAAMQGVVGVIGAPVNSAFDPSLEADLVKRTYTFLDANTADQQTVTAAGGYGANVFPSPVLDQSSCAAMHEPPLTSSGLKIDEFNPYIIEAIWTLADAIATIFTVPNNPSDLSTIELVRQRETIFQSLTNNQINEQLFRTLTTSLPSPLTGKPIKWLRNGDRYDIPLSLVNVQGKNFVTVGTWKSDVQPSDDGDNHGVIADGKHHYDGSWINRDALPSIIWSSGLQILPPDRVEHADHLGSIAILVGLVGIATSLVVGAVFHKYHISIVPESAAIVIVGMLIGIIVRFTASPEVRSTASFNGEFFMMVLLPIIIFESGYSLDRGPFFTQLFSINAYAILGTVISTIIIGGIVYLAGTTGAVISLSFEESMTFASLLSATDPVATLAVFGALRVDPVLNALVYGESVINDAVSLVLFRSFANFLVNDITTNAAMYAIFTFFVILVCSVLVGMAVGFLCTLIIRLINLTGILPKESEGLNSMLQRINAFQGSMMGRNQLPIIFKRTHSFQKSPKLAAVADPNALAAITGIAEDMGNVTTVDDDEPLYTPFNAGDVFAGIAETALLLIFSYVSFALAEAISLSGIVSSLFCGIIMNSYTRKILSISGRHVSSGVFKMLATLADTTVFFQIGLNVALLLGVGQYHAAFIAITLVGCLVGRAFNVFPISWLLNLGRENKITLRYQTQMWYAGLRGAIAFASALTFPTQNRTTIVNATSWICLFTIFAMGSTTTPLLKLLKVPYGITPTEEEQATEVNKATESSPTKRALRWIDHHIRRIIFGSVLLSLMAERGDPIIALSPVKPRRRSTIPSTINHSPVKENVSTVPTMYSGSGNENDTEKGKIVTQLELVTTADDWSNIAAEAVPTPSINTTTSG